MHNEPVASPSPPPQMLDILSDLDLTVTECEALPRERRDLVEHYRVKAVEGDFFLKLRRPERGSVKKAFHRVFGHPSMVRQIEVHAALEEHALAHLRVPRLVGADANRYVLMEYVTSDFDGRRDPDPDALVAALLEFQRSRARPTQRSLGGVLLDVALDPEVRTTRAVLSRIRTRLGVDVAWKCLGVLLHCRRVQPRLPWTTLVHNDFHPENVILAEDGGMYVTDFENVTTTRRWLLMDIVHFAVATHEMRIDTELIHRYIAALRKCHASETTVHFDVQLRMALLRRIVQHVTTKAPPPHVRTSYATFLTEVLLPDDAFQTWYAIHFT